MVLPDYCRMAVSVAVAHAGLRVQKPVGGDLHVVVPIFMRHLQNRAGLTASLEEGSSRTCSLAACPWRDWL